MASANASSEVIEQAIDFAAEALERPQRLRIDADAFSVFTGTLVISAMTHPPAELNSLQFAPRRHFSH